ncbi:C-type lectin domain family 12 member A-like [Carlito syrichta]|uniref:C-type lectin domain family 12 member A-like n=1 Tax=Carlito syrichta TaxID=1868482 RepID=A0A1U7U0Q7_CARSF|nr:C-type lectin domain family 12 member A-like [Carlito syrichta]
MSEEITYADLKFQDSCKTEHIQVLDKFGKKAPPAPSHTWHLATVALILICLLLLIGLGTLGSLFGITLKTEVEKVNKLQNINEELQKNVSLQLMNNMNSSNKIRNLSIVLQKIATNLCYELYRKNPEHKCIPCPNGWRWHEVSCYLLSDDLQTWQESKMMCAAQNASLLKINNMSELQFIKSQLLYDYWLGSPLKTKRTYAEKLDDIINFSTWDLREINDLNKTYCGYIYGTYVYYTPCTNNKKMLCEKIVNPVKIESTLMSEVSD